MAAALPAATPPPSAFTAAAGPAFAASPTDAAACHGRGRLAREHGHLGERRKLVARLHEHPLAAAKLAEQSDGAATVVGQQLRDHGAQLVVLEITALLADGAAALLRGDLPQWLVEWDCMHLPLQLRRRQRAILHLLGRAHPCALVAQQPRPALPLAGKAHQTRREVDDVTHRRELAPLRRAHHTAKRAAARHADARDGRPVEAVEPLVEGDR